jgi:hypothetical protein
MSDQLIISDGARLVDVLRDAGERLQLDENRLRSQITAQRFEITADGFVRRTEGAAETLVLVPTPQAPVLTPPGQTGRPSRGNLKDRVVAGFRDKLEKASSDTPIRLNTEHFEVVLKPVKLEDYTPAQRAFAQANPATLFVRLEVTGRGEVTQPMELGAMGSGTIQAGASMTIDYAYPYQLDLEKRDQDFAGFMQHLIANVGNRLEPLKDISALKLWSADAQLKLPPGTQLGLRMGMKGGFAVTPGDTSARVGGEGVLDVRFDREEGGRQKVRVTLTRTDDEAASQAYHHLFGSEGTLRVGANRSAVLGQGRTIDVDLTNADDRRAFERAFADFPRLRFDELDALGKTGYLFRTVQNESAGVNVEIPIEMVRIGGGYNGARSRTSEVVIPGRSGGKATSFEQARVQAERVGVGDAKALENTTAWSDLTQVRTGDTAGNFLVGVGISRNLGVASVNAGAEVSVKKTEHSTLIVRAKPRGLVNGFQSTLIDVEITHVDVETLTKAVAAHLGITLDRDVAASRLQAAVIDQLGGGAGLERIARELGKQGAKQAVKFLDKYAQASLAYQKLKLDGVEDIFKLTFDSTQPEQREAALAAMGGNPQDAFAQRLIRHTSKHVTHTESSKLGVRVGVLEHMAYHTHTAESIRRTTELSNGDILEVDGLGSTLDTGRKGLFETVDLDVKTWWVRSRVSQAVTDAGMGIFLSFTDKHTFGGELTPFEVMVDRLGATWLVRQRGMAGPFDNYGETTGDAQALILAAGMKRWLAADPREARTTFLSIARDNLGRTGVIEGSPEDALADAFAVATFGDQPLSAQERQARVAAWKALLATDPSLEERVARLAENHVPGDDCAEVLRRIHQSMSDAPLERTSDIYAAILSRYRKATLIRDFVRMERTGWTPPYYDDYSQARMGMIAEFSKLTGGGDLEKEQGFWSSSGKFQKMFEHPAIVAMRERLAADPNAPIPIADLRRAFREVLDGMLKDTNLGLTALNRWQELLTSVLYTTLADLAGPGNVVFTMQIHGDDVDLRAATPGAESAEIRRRGLVELGQRARDAERRALPVER